MKKNILLLVVSLFVVLPAFMMGAKGEVSVTKKLSVIETEYFDFIFPEESEPTAQYLAQQADDIYRKAADFLNIEPTLRFPVVVTPETDIHNAYFQLFPGFRIVMYDTVSLLFQAGSSDTLASTFYHEVIHALSLTIRTPFWQGYANIFGDMPSPWMMLNVPRSISEGTAVLAESLDGEGRLNNAYALHVIKQAKIEDKFPDWRDIAGAYQLYTDGSLPYIFGGAFLNYAYKTYGAKKFTDFWYELSMINFTFYEGVFKKVYAVSLDEVWQDFEDSTHIAPLSSPAQPLFSEKKVLNATDGQLFQHLTASPDGIAWQDGFSGTVYFLPNDSENKRSQTLYAKDSWEGRLHFSRDGRYLASSGYTFSSFLGNKAENIVQVYDMERGKFIRTQKGIREGTVLHIPQNAGIASDSPFNGVSTVLAGVKTDAALTSLILYNMDAEEDSAPLVTIPFERNNVLFEPIDAGNGLIVALMHNKGDWQFFVYDTITGDQRTYAIDEPSLSPSNIGTISASDTMLYMSYAPTPNSQPVLARINLADFTSDALTVYVQTEQVSGGVFAPVVISATESDDQLEGENVQIAYISRYYEHRDLSLLSIDSADSFEAVTFANYTDSSIETLIEFPVEPYRPLDYIGNGIIIPFFGASSSAFVGFLPQSFFPSIGISGMTTDPAGRLFMSGGAGYDIPTNNFIASLSTIFNENYFNASANIFAATSTTQFETFASNLQTSFTIPIGYNFNNVTFANKLSYFYLAEKNDDLLDGNTVNNLSSIYFTHARKTGQFFSDVLAFQAMAQVAVEKNFTNATPLDTEYAIALVVHTPQLLPFSNPDRFALNLPGTVTGYRYFDSEKTWAIQSKFIFFAYDIQEPLPIPFLPLFVQRIILDAGLNSVWYKVGDPEMTLHGNLFFTLTPNTGFYIIGIPIDLGASFTWKPHIGGVEGLEVGLTYKIGL